MEDQEAATLWNHDHTMGSTRLNVYGGPAGFYLLRDGRKMVLIGSDGFRGGGCGSERLRGGDSELGDAGHGLIRVEP